MPAARIEPSGCDPQVEDPVGAGRHVGDHLAVGAERGVEAAVVLVGDQAEGAPGRARRQDPAVPEGDHAVRRVVARQRRGASAVGREVRVRRAVGAQPGHAEGAPGRGRQGGDHHGLARGQRQHVASPAGRRTAGRSPGRPCRHRRTSGPATRDPRPPPAHRRAPAPPRPRAPRPVSSASWFESPVWPSRPSTAGHGTPQRGPAGRDDASRGSTVRRRSAVRHCRKRTASAHRRPAKLVMAPAATILPFRVATARASAVRRAKSTTAFPSLEKDRSRVPSAR